VSFKIIDRHRKQNLSVIINHFSSSDFHCGLDVQGWCCLAGVAPCGRLWATEIQGGKGGQVELTCDKHMATDMAGSVQRRALVHVGRDIPNRLESG
jgi:hypothetical protein